MKHFLFIAVALSAMLGMSCSQNPVLPELTNADSRAVSLWYLESTMKNATSLSAIAGVYWSARDMDSSPVGNHHFITLIYSSKAQADSFAASYGIAYKYYANQKNLTVYYTTIGAFTDNGNKSGKIVLTFNEGSDVQAVKEQVNPKKYIYWYKPDYDFEGHRVPYDISSRGFTNLDAWMRETVVTAQNFNRHHDAGITVEYTLVDYNCSCMVNSQFRSLGVSSGDRVILGEFSGVDWGEEDTISETYFDTIYN